MNQDWYQGQSWYTPLVREGEEEPDAPLSKPKYSSEKSRRGTAAWRAAGLALLILLSIAASSLAFRRSGQKGTDPAFSQKEKMPDSFQEFFEQYYEAVESDTAEVNIGKSDCSSDYVMIQSAAGEDELNLQEIYEKCAPSVVAIAAYEGKTVGYNWGSGIVLTGNGIILTNTHVLEDSDRAIVTLYDDSEYEAELIGADSISDIALLKIDADGLVPAEIGESASLRVGDAVAAIGNPLGESFRNTLTDGIISAIERGMSYHGRSMTLLQTNTAINEGNSGGALFNVYGQVVGITNMKMMSSYSSIEGIGFAIPSDTICSVVNALIQYGEVSGRPALGITVGVIPANASEEYDLPDGLYISEVEEGSDARTQGIRVGDIILSVDGTAVTTTAEISDMKNELQVGDSMTLRIWRNGEILEFDVKLVDMKDLES
ncbi:MAG: S1C family serine protease [Oscillospiraceae bacterium]|nr:S1C family serine protease [Oscillospiraceae bacterium]